LLALRVGYRTDTTEDLSAVAGFTTGVGLELWGQEFSYAWTPMGDLGGVKYFFILLRFGGAGQRKSNLIQYQNIENPHTAHGSSHSESADYQELMLLLNQSPERVAESKP